MHNVFFFPLILFSTWIQFEEVRRNDKKGMYAYKIVSFNEMKQQPGSIYSVHRIASSGYIPLCMGMPPQYV